jgi:hypothetical protein
MNRLRFFAAFASLAVLLPLSGCTISTHESKGQSGKNDNVDIRTPAGSLSVHSGDVDAKDTGLTVYPGAKVKPNANDKDENANVNLSMFGFGVKVVAVKFDSSDSSDKVMDFYRKELGKYGNVVQCDTNDSGFNYHKHRAGDDPVTCDHDNPGHRTQELKAGTQNNQHVVAVTPHGNSCEFALVYVRVRDGKDTI